MEIDVVPNQSSQTTSARTDVGKQFHSTKEVKQVSPGNASFRRGPGMLSEPVRQPQAAAMAKAGNVGQRNGKPAEQKRSNNVSLTGRLGRDAVVRHTKKGHTVANFSIAVDESYKDLLGQWRKKTAWHRVQVWQELAETVSAGLQKGVRVYVEGRPVSRNWIDQENRSRTSTEVVASDVRFLDAAPGRQTQSESEFSYEHSLELH